MTPTKHYNTKYGTKICSVCNQQYWKGHRDVKQWAESKTCSKICYHRSRIGIERPDAIEILKINRLKHRREKHWNWQGGITPVNRLIRHTPEYNNWRKEVYKRDYWTCQMCWKKQKRPVAHHLKSFEEYPDLRFEINNGITLCRSCHKKIHTLIGAETRFKKGTNINPKI